MSVNTLERYQIRALADRYRRRVTTFNNSCQQAGWDDTLVHTVATEYSRLLAYKNKYEVARLYCLPEFHKQLEDTFSGNYTIKVHLAPPLLSPPDSNGRPRKRAFGPGIIKLFRILQHAKRFRGTPLDVFGYTQEGRKEREWIKRYEEDMDAVQSLAGEISPAKALALLQVPAQIRGFGIVKSDAMVVAEAARTLALESLHNKDTMEYSKASLLSILRRNASGQ